MMFGSWRQGAGKGGKPSGGGPHGGPYAPRYGDPQQRNWGYDRGVGSGGQGSTGMIGQLNSVMDNFAALAVDVDFKVSERGQAWPPSEGQKTSAWPSLAPRGAQATPRVSECCATVCVTLLNGFLNGFKGS